MMHHRTAALVLASLALGAPLGAQQWRTVEVSRQLRDTSAHEVRIRYGAGSLDVRPTDDRMLFAMHLRYDEDAVTPVHRYDAAARVVTLGLSDASVRIGRSVGKESHGELRVALSRQVPTTLDLHLGAAEATLELGGMALRDAVIETGASDAKLGFAQPNRLPMRRLEVNAGAANLELSGLANARVGLLAIKGGVGNVEASFDGPLTRDVTIEAEVALGRVSVSVPREAGVRVELSRFIAGFDHFGLVKRGDAYYSANWDRAAHRIDMKVRTVLGSVAIQREDR